jgi:fluoride exporter
VGDLLAIALAGALGATCRWLVAGWTQRSWIGHVTWGQLPVGTLLVNVAGCLVLGLVVGLGSTALPPRWRLAASTGFLGSFTTFSTFGVETMTLVQSGETGVAAVNVALQLVFGLGAALVGLAAGRALSG